MRLLVTRPQPDAAGTAERLHALGHDVLIQPLLRVIFAEPPADMPSPRAILVTSRNAVRALAHWPQHAAWLDVPVFAAGLATGEAAAALGFRDVRSGAGDAATLAGRVADEVTPGTGPILYPAARDRSPLPEVLVRRGHDVLTVEAYRAEPAARLEPGIRAALAARMVDGVLLYSRRTSAAFRDLIQSERLETVLGGIVCYVISARAAEPLAGRAEKIEIAASPDEASLLALIPPAR